MKKFLLMAALASLLTGCGTIGIGIGFGGSHWSPGWGGGWDRDWHGGPSWDRDWHGNGWGHDNGFHGRGHR